MGKITKSIEIPFVKMNGLGNCFILMNDLDKQVSSSVELSMLAKSVCDVNFGIGADGLILAQQSSTHDFRMAIMNEDGSEAEMCGNGMRCFVRYLLENGLSDNFSLQMETLAGTIGTRVVQEDWADFRVEVDMGAPIFVNGDVIGRVQEKMVDVRIDETDFTYVSMGNPHAVAFVEDFEFDWQQKGAIVENAINVFPHRTNVEFVRIENCAEVTMKVWERGCGVTQACGTGACALVVAAVHKNKINAGNVLVHLPGGDLKINYQKGNSVRLTGNAVTVCSGVYLFNSKN